MCVSIVDVVLPAADVAELDLNACSLHGLCGNNLAVIHWLAQHGLIHNSLQCERCNQPMTLQLRRQLRFVDGYCWACPVCRSQKTVTCDSFFGGSHVPLIQMVDCIYWWSQEMKQTVAIWETGMSNKLVINWWNFIATFFAIS